MQKLSLDEFITISKEFFLQVDPEMSEETMKLLAENLQSRISKLTEIPEKIAFMSGLQDFDLELLVHKKSKSTLESSQQVLSDFLNILEDTEWNDDAIKAAMVDYAEANELKNGTVMFPIRIAVTGQSVTPGGTVEVLRYLGKEESLKRLQHSLDRLNNELK